MRAMYTKFMANSDLVVCLHQVAAPSASEWGEFCSNLERVQLAEGRFRHLVLSDGGGPTSVQRKQALQTGKYDNQRLAIVSGSVVLRGIGTAMSWFGADTRVWTPANIGEALTWLDLRPREIEFVVRAKEDAERVFGEKPVAAAASLTAPHLSGRQLHDR